MRKRTQIPQPAGCGEPRESSRRTSSYPEAVPLGRMLGTHLACRQGRGEVGTPKGDRSRIVLLAPYLLDLLREHRATQASTSGLGKLVFLSPEGCILNRHNVRRRGHDAALKDAGLSSMISAIPPQPSGWLQASRSTSSSSNSATPTFRRPLTSTGTRTSRHIVKLPLGLPPGGAKPLPNSSRYYGRYQEDAKLHRRHAPLGFGSGLDGTAIGTSTAR